MALLARNLNGRAGFTPLKETAVSKAPVRKPKGPEADAKGQSEKNHKGGTNNGVSSAEPRVLSGDEGGDATFPLNQDSRK